MRRYHRPGELFSYVDLEARVRRDHPLRAVRAIVNEALSALEREITALCWMAKSWRSCCQRCWR